MKLRTILIVFIALLSLTPFVAYLYKNLEPDQTLTQTVHTPAAIQNGSTTTAKIVTPENKSQLSTVETDKKQKVASKQQNTSKQKKASIEVKYPPAANRGSPLGINTNEIYEQDASIPFVDLFRVSMPFHENIRCRKQDMPCLTSAKVEYDKQGWPKKLNGGKAGVFFIRNVNRDAYPEGDFSVLYDGEGKIEYLQNAELKSSVQKVKIRLN